MSFLKGSGPGVRPAISRYGARQGYVRDDSAFTRGPGAIAAVDAASPARRMARQQALIESARRDRMRARFASAMGATTDSRSHKTGGAYSSSPVPAGVAGPQRLLPASPGLPPGVTAGAGGAPAPRPGFVWVAGTATVPGHYERSMPGGTPGGAGVIDQPISPAPPGSSPGTVGAGTTPTSTALPGDTTGTTSAAPPAPASSGGGGGAGLPYDPTTGGNTGIVGPMQPPPDLTLPDTSAPAAAAASLPFGLTPTTLAIGAAAVFGAWMLMKRKKT